MQRMAEDGHRILTTLHTKSLINRAKNRHLRILIARSVIWPSTIMVLASLPYLAYRGALNIQALAAILSCMGLALFLARKDLFPQKPCRIGHLKMTSDEFMTQMRKDTIVSADGTTGYIGKGKSQ